MLNGSHKQGTVSMSENFGERADELLEYLAYAVPNATLEYEHTAALHRYVITRVGLSYSLSFPDWVLRTATLDELQRTIAPAIKRVLLGSTPRRVWVGGWYSEVPPA
jgi:hypothetical protein